MDPKRPKITPTQLSFYTAQVTDIYRALENEVFQMIAKRLKTPPDLDKDYVLQWQVEKMQQLRMLNSETIKALAATTGIAEKEIRKAIGDVGYDTIKSVDEELKSVYAKLPPPSHIDIVLETFVAQTFREFDNFVNQTLITSNLGEGTVSRMYRKIVEETTGRVLAGTTTINQAVAETTIRWANKGLETGFVDRGGKVWTLERYAETVIRSTVNRTYNELRMSRMQDYGVDLVLVSSLPDAREICSLIQGRVASMSNPSSDSEYPSIYDYGYGTPGGIRGINCRHMFYPFVEGVNENNQPQYDESDVHERYEQTQKQRYYERQIRQAKRSLKLAEELGDPDSIQKYKNLVRSRQARLRDFINENKLPRRYDKERIIVPVSKSEVDTLRLPNYKNAIIPEAKLTKYALDPNGKAPDKAIAFEKALGYNKGNYQDLIKNVIDNLPIYEAVPKTKDQWGQRYEVRMKLTGPNGKEATVLTAWIQDSSTGEMKLTSIYVK